MVAVTGNTYLVREQLRSLGGKWDVTNKCWLVPDEKADEARKLVESGTTTPTTSKSFRHTKCKVCGFRPSNRYEKIYRSGECKDCYEERKMGY